MPSPDRLRLLVALSVLAAVFTGSFLSVQVLTTELAKADLSTEQDWPVDVSEAVGETWSNFTDRFEVHRSCFDDVEVRLVRELDAGDARYLRAERRVEILIPTSLRRFRESLVHELAHHVEMTCARHVELRVELGYPTWDDWKSGAEWEEVPSERYAEAVVQLVNGERVRFGRSMPLDESWVEAVGKWIDSA